jgi:LCP family protein required for cell wall assembly
MGDESHRSRADTPAGDSESAAGRLAARHDGGRRRAVLATVWTLAGALVLGGAGIGYLFYRLNGNLTGIDINAVLGRDRPSDVANGSVDILVLGSDSRAGKNSEYGGKDGGTSRSDTAMVVHVYRGHRRATVVSIPRDTLVERPPCTNESGAKQAGQDKGESTGARTPTPTAAGESRADAKAQDAAARATGRTTPAAKATAESTATVSGKSPSKAPTRPTGRAETKAAVEPDPGAKTSPTAGTTAEATPSPEATSTPGPTPQDADESKDESGSHRKGKDKHQDRGAKQAMFNSAYQVGGPACAVKTVEAMTGIRMDHYLELDFSGFRKLVDKLGGVDITTTEPIHDKDSHLDLAPGKHNLDGKQALGLVRTRHGVGDGSDLGRIKLQQAFIGALLDQIRSVDLFDSPKRLYALADTSTKALTTDSELASVDRLLGFARGLRSIGSDDTEMITLPVRFDPDDPNRVVPIKDKAEQVWAALRTDKPVPRSATKGAAGDQTNADRVVERPATRPADRRRPVKGAAGPEEPLGGPEQRSGAEPGRTAGTAGTAGGGTRSSAKPSATTPKPPAKPSAEPSATGPERSAKPPAKPSAKPTKPS